MSDKPSFGAELRAIAREAIKDVRQTVNEVAFGKPEHAPENGTPLNPTTAEVTQDRQYSFSARLEAAHGRDHQQEREPEMER